MKKLIFTTVILIMAITQIYADNWEWINSISSLGEVKIKSIKQDDSGIIYVLGFFVGDLNFHSQNGAIISRFSTDSVQNMFLAKYNPDGYLLWAEQGKSLGDVFPWDLVIDDNNIMVVGAYKNSNIIFDNDTLENMDDRDCFLVNYSSDSSVVYAKRIAWGTGPENIQSLVIDNNNELFMVGNFKTEVIFDTTSFTALGSGKDQFIAKYDSLGNFLWAKHYKNNHNSSLLFQVEKCLDEGFYIGGRYAGTLYIENDSLTASGDDIILMKINNEGNTEWIRLAGGISYDRCNSIIADSTGNLYMAGYISEIAQFDSTGTGIFDGTSITSKGEWDILIAKYDKQGTLKWKTSNGGSGYDNSYGISIKDNLVLIAGYLSG